MQDKSVEPWRSCELYLSDIRNLEKSQNAIHALSLQSSKEFEVFIEYLELKCQCDEGIDPDSDLAIRTMIAALKISKEFNIENDPTSSKYRLNHASKDFIVYKTSHSNLMRNIVSKDDVASVDMLLEYGDYEYAYEFVGCNYALAGFDEIKEKLTSPSTINIISNELYREQFNYFLAWIMVYRTMNDKGLTIVAGKPNRMNRNAGIFSVGNCSDRSSERISEFNTRATEIFENFVVEINNILWTNPSIATSKKLMAVLNRASSPLSVLESQYHKFWEMHHDRVARILHEFGVTEDMMNLARHHSDLLKN